jgi:hypothetical protein
MIKLFLFPISILIFLSCIKEEIISPYYLVSVKNSYFEPLDSIYIGNKNIGNLDINQISDQDTLSPGTYKIKCKTASNLQISADIILQGSQQHTQIVLLQNGKIIIIQ